MRGCPTWPGFLVGGSGVVCHIPAIFLCVFFRSLLMLCHIGILSSFPERTSYSFFSLVSTLETETFLSFRLLWANKLNDESSDRMVDVVIFPSV